MDISVFFKKPGFNLDPEELSSNSILANHISVFNGDLEELTGKQIAIIGVLEDRHAGKNQGCANGPDLIRSYLYKLFRFDQQPEIIDLGNIEAGHEVSDTYYALNQTCQVLLKKGIIPVIIGGSQDLTYANYLAYEHMEQTVILVTVDYTLDFGASESDLTSKGYLNKIILHKPNYLFNYGNIGHQRYLTDPALIDLTNKMYFDVMRLGEAQDNMLATEPTIRNADIFSFDMSSVRQAENPASAYAGPNGFNGQQAAQLCWFAGLSDKLSSFGIYEYNPALDHDGQGAHLAAQMIWCFIDGFCQRKKDYPVGDYEEYLRYMVTLETENHELVFYKSNKSDRWWMDVPYPAGQDRKFERHHLVPCTYSEYMQACNYEMPDRWWRTYQKLV